MIGSGMIGTKEKNDWGRDGSRPEGGPRPGGGKPFVYWTPMTGTSVYRVKRRGITDILVSGDPVQIPSPTGIIVLSLLLLHQDTYTLRPETHTVERIHVFRPTVTLIHPGPFRDPALTPPDNQI